MKFRPNGISDNYRFVKTLLAIFIAFVAIAASVVAQRKELGTRSKALARTSAVSTPAWPQWGGPNRNFKVAAHGIKEK